jgi:hypothetical protein
MSTAPKLTVGSLRELRERETDILGWLREIPNGERLFLLHPFRALSDVGVVLDDGVSAELLRMHPNLVTRSDTPYDALRASEARQPGTVRLAGLFRWDTP